MLRQRLDQVTTHKWRIEHFSLMAPEDGDPGLRGRNFKLNGSDDIECWMKLYDAEDFGGSADYIMLRVGSNSFEYGLMEMVDMTFWVEDTRGEKFAQRSTKEDPMEYYNKKYRRYLEFVRKDEIINFIANDVIIVCCEIRPKSVIDEPSLPDHDVSEKIEALCKQDVKGTCTIQVGTKEFEVYKPLLMAHSPVFERMFMSDTMTEAQTGVVQIADTNPDVMQAFVLYIHSGRVSNLENAAEGLYMLAHKYEVEGLKTKCMECLVETLGQNNIISRLFIGFLYDHAALKEATLNYLMESGSDVTFKHVFKSEEWLDLLNNRKEIAYDIMDAYFDKAS